MRRSVRRPWVAQKWAETADQHVAFGVVVDPCIPQFKAKLTSSYGARSPAATSGTDIDIYFRLEYNPHPDVDPAYNTGSITISGTEPKEYSVEIEPQGTNTYSSMIFYLQTRDQELVVSSEFDINTY